MQTLTVQTPSHHYPIIIGEGIGHDFSLWQPYIGRKVMIVTNDCLAKLYLQPLHDMLRSNGIESFDVVLEDGEQYKNHHSLNRIYDALLGHHADRKTTIIALGGGVVGDMAGFAAATYQRGIPFIQMPTTLLSQIDSSVGGKTAINHPLGKNMIGAFYQPQLVMIDLQTLQTLPDRELSAGLAELIKYALLGDAALLDWLETHIEGLRRRDMALLEYAVAAACRMKADIVAQDETEQGIRAWLNLGHTFGHAIETEMGYGNWLHGEAVAAGMVLACRLSEQLGSLNSGDTQRVRDLLCRAGLPDTPPVFAFEQWLAHMRHDKKVLDGTMRFIALNRLGQAAIVSVGQTGLLQRTLEPYLP